MLHVYVRAIIIYKPPHELHQVPMWVLALALVCIDPYLCKMVLYTYGPRAWVCASIETALVLVQVVDETNHPTLKKIFQTGFIYC